MDIIMAVLIAACICASSVLAAVGVGVGSYAYGQFYRYRTNQVEVQEMTNKLMEHRQNFNRLYSDYSSEFSRLDAELLDSHKTLFTKVNGVIK